MIHCPGCGLDRPGIDRRYDGYYRTTPECWAVYEQVLEREFGDAVLFSQVHQLTVDSYALQHAGGAHKDKSVCVHLVGLCLVFRHDFAPLDVNARVRRLASDRPAWPHFAPPADVGPRTVGDIAASSRDGHSARVRAWAEQVWNAWRDHHDALSPLIERCFAGPRHR